MRIFQLLRVFYEDYFKFIYSKRANPHSPKKTNPFLRLRVGFLYV